VTRFADEPDAVDQLELAARQPEKLRDQRLEQRVLVVEEFHHAPL